MRDPALSSARFELLREVGSGGMGVVFEALDRETNAIVALKMLKTRDAHLLYRFKQEFRALADVQHPNILRFGELHHEGDQWFFTMELVRGVDLLAYVRHGASASSPLDEKTRDASPAGRRRRAREIETEDDATLHDEPREHVADEPSPIACEVGYDEARLRSTLRQLASAIDALHRRGRLHRDVKPSNVLVRDDGHVVLLDFGLVERFGTTVERHVEKSGERAIVGTPHFIAPEVVDDDVGPEADWYAFGVLLFKALTGTLPFRGHPLVVMREKRERAAPAPSDLVPGAPPDLDRLCRALLERDPAVRPCGDDVLRALGAEPPADDLVASEPDGAAMLEVPAAFVGRRRELATLADAFVRVASSGRELVVVRGEPGVGKSTLVRAFLEQHVAPDRDALVLAGRCYEQESVPFKAFDAIIDALSAHIAALPIAEARALLAGGAQFLAMMFPVLRRAPAVAEMVTPGSALRNVSLMRDLAFRELKDVLGALSERARLVVFVDDLQWADRDSLALLEALFAQPGAPRALFVATMRAGSAEMQARLDALSPRTLDLGGLSHEESKALWNLLWIANGGPHAGLARRDAASFLDEAGGHPLFLSELVRFARRPQRGATSRARLQDVIWTRIAELDEPARRFMEMVALAGAPFPFQLIARAAGLDVSQSAILIGALRTAQMIRVSRHGEDRLVEPYHDRIREAIRRHFDDGGEAMAARLRHLHLSLGLELVAHTSSAALPSVVFAIVQHLHQAGDLVSSRDARRRFAELCLVAGRQAKQTTAYRAALEYLERATVLIAGLGDPWTTEHALACSVWWERMESAYLAGEIDLAKRLFAELLQRLADPAERARLYASRIALETGHGRSVEAIATAREALRSFGQSLPANASTASVLLEYAAVRWAVGRRSAEKLAALPELEDVRARCAIEILVAMVPAAFFVSTDLLVVVSLRIAQLSLHHGVMDASAYGFALYGAVLSGAFGDHANAHAFGRLSLVLQERFRSERFACKLLFVNGTYLTPWVEPFAAAKAQLRDAVSVGTRYGDTAYEAYSAGTLSVITYCDAAHLGELRETAEACRAIAVRRRDVDMAALASTHARYAAAMRGPDGDATTLAAEDSDDATFRASLSERKTPVAIFYYHLLGAQLAYLHDDDARASALLAECDRHVGAVFSVPTSVELEAWRVLVGARSHRSAGALERAQIAWRARGSLAKLARWAQVNPQSFEPLYLVALAEHARVRGASDAVAHFEQAVERTRAHRRGKWEALALELLWRFHAERGDHAIEQLREARDAYARWGAERRAAELSQRLAR
ncbi:serine/threonine-protein kinase PknK [Sandaracinus amylolyticus]|uniref:serine/threonine-protein kinase n=1 Tax=Sandaracinus amylolyticus TaxID=927083 RepID=UPI001F15F982|nr:serine/threonine-protein kinase [Sandaracinus amylolyticus]UJR81895.1 Serine/threonine protein kinase [Sandaracinus amylolyticus]